MSDEVEGLLENGEMKARRRLSQLTDPDEWTEEEKKRFEHVRSFQIREGKSEEEAEKIALRTVREQRDQDEGAKTDSIRTTTQAAARKDEKHRADKAERTLERHSSDSADIETRTSGSDAASRETRTRGAERTDHGLDRI